MHIILASQSEGRKRLLDSLGITYQILPSNIDEKAIRHETPEELVKRISEAKAKAVAEKLNPNEPTIIIAGDVVVAVAFAKESKKQIRSIKPIILEKPSTKEEAIKMLSLLSGTTFDVVAGCAVFNTKTKTLTTDADTCSVTFRTLTKEEINDYVARCHVTSYAGAFEENGLQRFSAKVNGSPSTIVGLPMQKLIPLLRKERVVV